MPHRTRPRIRVHPFAISGLFLMMIAADRAYVFAVFSSILLHELGHLTALRLLGKSPKYIRVMPTGISIGIPPASSYAEEIFVSAAGPLMNLLYIGVASAFPSALAETTKAVSLLLFLLNLLPIGDFDGGHILSAFLSLWLGETAASRILRIATAAALAFLWVIALYILFYSGINMTLLIFCAYLFSYLILKKTCHDEKNMVK